MLLPPMIKIIEYVNGGSIYLSSIHPIAYDTQEIQEHNINVVISLMEEEQIQDVIFREMKQAGVRHYYYSCSEQQTSIRKLFNPTFNTIYKTIDYGRNILIHCRSGESLCVSILISFFLKIMHTDQQYLIYDLLNMIPKSKTNWTDSFLDFIRMYYPQAKPSQVFLDELYSYETQLENPIKVKHLFTFKPFTLRSTE